jgi:phosphatidylinositol alpha 1,6-mannosyltransferase
LQQAEGYWKGRTMNDTVANNRTERKLRVAYFAGTMRPGHDGVTRVLYRLIDALNSQGVESVFFSPIVPERGRQPVPMHKVPSVTFPLYRDYRLPVPGYRHFERTLGRFHPDLLHINSPCPLGHAAVHYGQRYGIPVVATYHTHFPSYAKYYRVGALETLGWNYFRRLYNACERVYVPSRPVMEELSAHGLSTVQFLPHGVDPELFNPSYRSTEWRRHHGMEGETALLFVGRLVWEKDLRTLASAYAEITPRRRDVLFVLAGDGPAREELQQMMPEALFLGHQSGVNLSRTYASSDIFIFPSTTETFGNVTLEAMASGLPPVCAKEGGAYGFVEPKVTGMLAAPRDPQDFARQVEYLLNHTERRKQMGEAARAFAREQSWEKIFTRLFESYAEVLAEYRLGKTRAA